MVSGSRKSIKRQIVLPQLPGNSTLAYYQTVFGITSDPRAPEHFSSLAFSAMAAGLADLQRIPPFRE
jgi:hypothetical protein